ncbi:hypothetical protein MHM95_04375 [Pseudoalteromonas sp. CnMc7-15]|uniref:hypothetical protein n=1 Tax=unclassified Pseudoalteromonas TaxID=194690 RepID=UPI001EF5273B|nr:hypothetical protein [Pseudoalteromonas sp. CnMc7-15]MCG7565514.1 hypothetical protein [Pseudoalteromonas sp. CnMc7-15]
MKSYRLELPKESTTALIFDSYILAKQMTQQSKLSVNELLIKLQRLPYENQPLSSLWDGEQLSFTFNSESNDDFDINIVGTYLLLKMSAYSVLKSFMADFGEFIKVNTDRGEMMLFNLLTFAKEDLSLTERAYLDGFEDGLKSLVFDENDIRNKNLYKSKLEGGNLVYCNELFFNAVKNNKLTGIAFYTDLLSTFPEN